ncbi:hypothetical protein MMC10_000989 [Thelotrema lepadinum]|nr:hypothetical protein [Thelotrema lepadinum]
MSTLSELQATVVDWHGLDPSKFGDLRLFGRFESSRDGQTWLEKAECYLFDKIMVITMEKEPSKRSLRGSVLLKHLKAVARSGDQSEVLEMNLEVDQLPLLKLRSVDKSQLDAWNDVLSSMVNTTK